MVDVINYINFLILFDYDNIKQMYNENKEKGIICTNKTQHLLFFFPFLSFLYWSLSSEIWCWSTTQSSSSPEGESRFSDLNSAIHLGMCKPFRNVTNVIASYHNQTWPQIDSSSVTSTFDLLTLQPNCATRITFSIKQNLGLGKLLFQSGVM